MKTLSNIIKRIFHKTSKIEYYVTAGYLEELKGTSERLSKMIDEDSMSIIDARCYYKHIPIREKHPNWTEEIYVLADSCHRKLYDYCIKKRYIKAETSYKSYLENGI